MPTPRKSHPTPSSPASSAEPLAATAAETASGGFTTGVAAWRQARGWSQAELARASGVSRAAISAIELGRLVPSTAAALKLARALEVTVETLFQLEPGGARAEWAWPSPSTRGGTTRVWHATVGGRRRLYPVEPTSAGTLAHDGVARIADTETVAAREDADAADDTSIARRHGAAVRSRRETPSAVSFATGACDPERTLVLAGCDPTMALLAQVVGERSGFRVLPLWRSSREALDLLRRGLVHAAGLHLQGERSSAATAHDRLVRQAVGAGARLVHVTRWDAGIAVNPARRERSVAALLRGGVRWVNREEGSGARACLDRLVDAHRRPLGYDHVVHNHRAVADTVGSGWAEAGICLRAVAEESGLDFLSIQQETYELCVAPAAIDDPRVTALIDAVRSLTYRRLIGDIPGFTNTDTGALRDVA